MFDSPNGYASNGQVRLAYWEQGSGPPLLLIMGIFHRAAYWTREVVDVLARDFRVIVFDNRGTGLSTKPVDEINVDLWAGDALAVLDALGVARAAVIGYSMGGRVAQQLMVQAPERLTRVVLLSAAVGGEHGIAPTSEALATFAGRPGVAPEEARRESLLALAAPGYAERDPAGVRGFVDLGATRRTPVSTLLNQLGVISTDVCEELATTTMPTLIVQGDADPLVQPANADVLMRFLPHAERVDIPNCGHMVAWEAPGALLRAVVPFLKA